MSPETAALIARAERVCQESAALVEELDRTIRRGLYAVEEYRRWREHAAHVHWRLLRKMADAARQEAVYSGASAARDVTGN